MSDEGAGGLVCGFGDLDAGLGALAWDLDGGGAVLLRDRTASATAADISGDGEIRVKLAGEDPIEATLSADRDPAPLSNPPVDSPRSSAPQAIARLSGGTLTCRGHLTRWEESPLEGAGTFRYLAVERDQGSVLIATAWGEPGLEGHGQERISAWTIEAGGSVQEFEEALLSTQYDRRQNPTRAGLELWPGDDAPPTRVAASLIGGAEAGGAWAGILRCSGDGIEGLGSYLLWRA